MQKLDDEDKLWPKGSTDKCCGGVEERAASINNMKRAWNLDGTCIIGRACKKGLASTACGPGLILFMGICK
jgi:hypothetical protein